MDPDPNISVTSLLSHAQEESERARNHARDALALLQEVAMADILSSTARATHTPPSLTPKPTPCATKEGVLTELRICIEHLAKKPTALVMQPVTVNGMVQSLFPSMKR
jgi:hypothetical protein